MSATALARVSPPDAAAWDALVADAEGASLFHTAAWASIWTDEWRDARWEALVLPSESGGYAAGLGAIVRRRGPFRTLHAMPFATYGGPIVRRGHPDPAGARRALLERFADWTDRRGVLRSELAWYGGCAQELPEGLPVAEAFTHVLPLAPSLEALSERFAPATRRLVRQGMESGLSIDAVSDEAGLRAFYALASETVRRRGGRPKPFSLYRRIAATLGPPGLARYHLVRHGEETIAGSLHFFHQGIATSWLPVSRAATWHLRPNNFLIAHVLESLCEAGYLEYNFGASPPDAAGLIRFKEGWGAERRTVLIAGRRSGLHRRLRS